MDPTASAIQKPPPPLPPLEDDSECDDTLGDTSSQGTTTRALLPRLLRRKSTRRRSIYAAHHISLAIELDRSTFRLVWILLLLLRLTCALFLVFTAQIYWFVAHPYMGYYATLIGPSAVADFRPMGVCFGLVAALQAFQVYKMIYWSWHYNKLVTGPPPRSLGPDGDSLCFRDWSSRFRSLEVFRTTFKRDFSRLFFDRHGPFGVESSFFYLRFLLNELLEVTTQTTQVYTASMLVAKVWLNNAYVTVTVLNCWSTPFVRFLFRNRHDPKAVALERLLILVLDFVLDATTAMAIPLLLFVPYYQKFDFTVYNFEAAYLYDDIWFATMVMENQQLLAQTRWDFLWKMVPHFSIYFGLNSIRGLVRPPRVVGRARVHCDAPPLPLPPPQIPGSTTVVEPYKPDDASLEPPQQQTSSIATISAVDENTLDDSPSRHYSKPRNALRSFPAIPEGKLLKSPSMDVIRRDLAFLDDSTWLPSSVRSAAQQEASHAQSRRMRQLQNAIKAALFLCGLALLVLHVRAARRAQSVSLESCVTRTRPWFATKVTCSVVRYNCYMNNVTTVTDAALEMIEPSGVGAFVFSHCADLRVPTIVSRFHNLLGIDIYNSTLTEWSVDAAITAENHPRLTYIIFVRTNMTRLPDGVLQQLPDTMSDFEISVSNLTRLPDNLHELWHPMSLLYVEHAHLTEFPTTLLHLPVADLSLIGNHIDRLPEFPPSIAFFSLAMSRTPLVELPQSIGDVTHLGFLSLAYTQLEELPTWMDRVVETATKIFVHHTPFCTSKSEEEIARDFGDDAVLSCSTSGDLYINGRYPLEIVARNRPLLSTVRVIETSTHTPRTTND